MKRLPDYFYRKGFRYDLIDRKGDIACYSQTTTALEKVVGYEVFKVQSHNGRQIGDHFFPAAEYVPSDAQWGKFGWTFYHKDKAIEKFLELING